MMRQGLTDAVDLVIVSAIRKGEELGFQFREPWSLGGKQNLTAFELPRLDRHSRLLDCHLRCSGGGAQLLCLYFERPFGPARPHIVAVRRTAAHVRIGSGTTWPLAKLQKPPWYDRDPWRSSWVNIAKAWYARF